MSNARDNREKLQQRIREKQGQIQAFLAKAQPRTTRLAIASIVCAGLAGLLTAGPAAGGPSFTQALTETLGTTSPSWRLLCAAATVLSFLATTMLSIHKIQDLPDRVAKAQAAYSRLEAIETLLETTEISTSTAADQYAQIVHDVSFVPAQT
ncbi:MAG TPA: hypothetical protein VHM64_02175 [Candidatus Binatia bacterium]|nr:hypothetical protein [Candidatus Binatia bacterium]